MTVRTCGLERHPGTGAEMRRERKPPPSGPSPGLVDLNQATSFFEMVCAGYLVESVVLEPGSLTRSSKSAR